MSIVIKQAHPPTKLEMGSAQKTPSTPHPFIIGKKIVSGTTIIALRNNEKKVAFFAFPNATKTHCPANCNAIKQKPKNKRVFKKEFKRNYPMAD